MIQSAMACGGPSIVNIQAKEADKPMMMSTDTVINADRAKMSGSAFHSKVR